MSYNTKAVAWENHQFAIHESEINKEEAISELACLMVDDTDSFDRVALRSLELLPEDPDDDLDCANKDTSTCTVCPCEHMKNKAYARYQSDDSFKTAVDELIFDECLARAVAQLS